MEQLGLNFMIVAGEASGDMHAAKLVTALREAPGGANATFFGSAGPRMRQKGVEAVVYSDQLSVVGLAEIARKLPMFIKARDQLIDAARDRQPDTVILVDFPDFNLKLARRLKKEGMRIIYYISPQIWAWRKSRIKTIRECVDLMITILPFEKAWYEAEGFTKVIYVGSPLAREVHPFVSKAAFLKTHGLEAARPLIALLPGSRHKEIVKILPEMFDSAVLIKERFPTSRYVIAATDETTKADIEQILPKIAKARKRPEVDIRIVAGETYDLLNAADAAAITSGTATLEAGIIGTPMAIVYKTSKLNYKLLRPLISVEHFGLVNLIAGERVASELIQDDLSPRTLADEMIRLLEPEVNLATRKKLGEAADKLGHGGASARAAEAIIGFVTED